MSLDRRWYIYRHLRNDTGAVFYVGRGCVRSNRAFGLERAYDIKGRSPYWSNVVSSAGGFTVEVMLIDLTKEQANLKEKEFITLYGRRNLGEGVLCNLTDGGDGGCRLVFTAEMREKWSRMHGGDRHPNWGKRLSADTIRKKSESTKGPKHHLYGKTLPAEWKARIRLANVGERNHRFGLRGADCGQSKRVIDEATGQMYGSIAEAAHAVGLTPSIAYQYLDGTRKNKTTLRKLP